MDAFEEGVQLGPVSFAQFEFLPWLLVKNFIEQHTFILPSGRFLYSFYTIKMHWAINIKCFSDSLVFVV